MRTFKTTSLCKRAFYSKETRKALPYVMFFGHWWQRIVGKYSTVQAFVSGSPTWTEEGMVKGFQRICEISESKKQFVYRVYSKEEIKEDKSRKDAVIMHFPGNSNEKKPFIVVCPGGGFSCVCSCAEGFGTAKAFNDLGYTVFVVNYRVYERPLMPLPINDLAKAISYINEHADEFNVLKDQYVVNGFSAGGNLINLFCSKQVGYEKYGLAKPLMAIPVYAGCDFATDDKHSNMFKYSVRLLGTTNHQYIDRFLVSKNVETFPKSFFVFAEDDDVVDPKASRKTAELLFEFGIPNKIMSASHGRHGFGSGEGTQLEGWPKAAIEYFEEK